MILLIEYENKSREMCDKYIFNVRIYIFSNAKKNEKSNEDKK